MQNIDVSDSLPPIKDSRVLAMIPSSNSVSEEKKVKFADMLFTNMSSLRSAV